MLHPLIQNTSATSITASKVPAIAGPAMRERFRTALLTATALATWLSGTRFGIRELRTGTTRVIHSPVWLTRFPAAKIPKDRERRANRVGEERTSTRALGFKFI